MISTTRLFMYLAFLPMMVVPIADVVPAFAPFVSSRFIIFFVFCVLIGLVSKYWNTKGYFSNFLVALAFMGVLSAIWSEDVSITFSRSLLNLSVILGLTILYASQSSAELFSAIRIYSAIIATVLLSFCGAALLFMGPNAYHMENFTGPFSNPNSLALLVLVFCVPTALRNFSFGGRSKILGLALIGFAVFIIYLTRSRAALLGVITFLIVWSVLQENRRFRWLVYMCGVTFCVMLGSIVYTLFIGKYEAISPFGTRAILWNLHFDAIWDRPLLGYGLGVNPVDFKNIENFLYDTEKGSSLITVVEELGVLFSTIFLASLIYSLTRLFSFIRHRTFGTDRAVLSAVFAGVSASLVHSVFESWIFSFGNPAALMFWLSVAALSKFYVTQNSAMPR